MFEKFINKILHDSEYEKSDSPHELPVTRKPMSRLTKVEILSSIFVLLLAVIPRLYFLFCVGDPQNAGVGWYGDTYHHWQIAYLTKTVGLSHGFLRLWDLKGMEYFWGLAHPLTVAALMAITGSTDILVPRLLSLFAGSLSIVFLYLIAKRYWGNSVAWVAAIFGALNPVSIFNDASGMQEPFGMVFFFAGLYFWPERPWLFGILLAIASMTRAEFWLFSVGLLIALTFFVKERVDRKSLAVVSYSAVMLLYMKYLLDRTGNAIYPIWWNFLGNAAGQWQANIPITSLQRMVQPIWIAMFVISLAGIIYVIWKKPKGKLLHFLGLGNFLFLGAFVGMTDYIKSYVNYFWVVRIFSLPYLYLGALIGIFLFVVIPKRVRIFNKLKLGWVFVILILLASQFAWKVIWSYYQPTEKTWDDEIQLADDVAKVYKGGTVLIHEGDPTMTYALVKYAGITGENIEGQMYDPFQYKPFTSYSDPFVNWSKDRTIIIDWLKKDNIKLLIFLSNRQRYIELVQKEPGVFKYVEDLPFGLKLYEVTI